MRTVAVVGASLAEDSRRIRPVAVHGVNRTRSFMRWDRRLATEATWKDGSL